MNGDGEWRSISDVVSGVLGSMRIPGPQLVGMPASVSANASVSVASSERMRPRERQVRG